MKLSWLVSMALATVPLSALAFAQTAPGYDALIQQGKTQLQAAKPDQAVASAEQAIKSDATRWEGYALAGGALMNLKRYDQAVNRFTDAVERAPQEKQDGLRELRRQCFAAESGTAPASPPSTATIPGATEGTATQAEIVLWKSIENSTNPQDLETYLQQFPSGAFAALARQHLEQLRLQQNSFEWRPSIAEDNKAASIDDTSTFLITTLGNLNGFGNHLRVNGSGCHVVPVYLESSFGVGMTFNNGNTTVIALQPNSPAQAAGTRVGDVVLEVDGHQIRSSSEFLDYMRQKKEPSAVRITYERNGKKSKVQIIPVPLLRVATYSIDFGQVDPQSIVVKQLASNVYDIGLSGTNNAAIGTFTQDTYYGVDASQTATNPSLLSPCKTEDKDCYVHPIATEVPAGTVFRFGDLETAKRYARALMHASLACGGTKAVSPF